MERDTAFVIPTTYAANEIIQQAVAGTGVEFVSPLSTLCNGEGCLLVVPGTDGKPIYWDDNHLTRTGSIYFIEQIGRHSQDLDQPMIRFEPGAKGPLDGIRVLDLSRLVAGNMLSLQLGDFGADVIKIEPPEGDPLREWRDDGKSLHWKTYCRNKRSIVLNLRHAAAKAALLRLVAKADVLIENYRPGTLEEMGLAPDVLHKANANLIIVRVSGFGQTGPYAPHARLRHAGRGDERLRLAHRISRSRAGAAAAGARRHDGGPLWRVRHGHRVARPRQWRCEGPGHRPVAAGIGVLGARPRGGHLRGTGKVKERSGSASNTSSPRNVYRCSDGNYVAVSGLDPGDGEAAVRDDRQARDDRGSAVSHQHRPRQEPRDRGRDRRRLVRHQDHDEALRIMRDGSVTVGPVYSIADAMQDAHFRERGIIVDVEDAELGKLPMHNILPRFSQTPGVWQKPAPGLGEHTDAVLAEAGLSAEEIARLRKDGAAA